ncbi:MAG TPA: hypothetical protein VKZ45_10055 [Vicingaceae bacterium]|jgi:nitrite reductase/ring-hydroxylating ferredoxin subunit|nr:hypothetical protein [Vicingaceae bacterium]
MKLFFKITLFTLIIISFSSCNKDENANIPYVPVNIYMQTTDPQFIQLNAVNSWIYITGGSRGIIVYKVSNEQFRAFDRHCTFQPAETCALVNVETNNVSALCDCCGSQFLITDGSVLRSPAVLPLREYNTSYDGATLRIFN